MTTVEIAGERILVRAPFSMSGQLRTVPGAKWSPTLRAWTYPTAAALALRAVVQDPALDRLAEPPSVDDVPGLRTKLWAHQRRALAFTLERPAAMLGLEMGLGKSAVTVAAALAWDCRRVLVACPLSVVGVWPREFDRHSAAPWQIARLDTGSVADKAAAAELALKSEQRTVIVINHESVWRDPFKSLALRAGWDLVVADEGHRLKAPGGKASQFFALLGRKVPRRLNLTGTPLPHSPLDAYGQFRFLDPSVFGTSFIRFRAKYAVMTRAQRRDGHEFSHIVGWQNMDDFDRRLGSLAIRIRKDQALDLPEELDLERRCSLEPAAAKLYRDLESNLTGEIEAGTITASNALVQLLRLQQVTSGTLKLDGGGLEVVSQAKARLLADVLEDLPLREPIVVFTRFIADLDRIREIAEAQGRRVGELSGRRKDLTPSATMPEDIDVLAVQIQAGGVGVDLTRAATAIYYSHGWSLGDLLQSRARLHRPGQTRPVSYIHLLADKTVDEKTMAALAKREDLVESILKRLE